MRLMSTSRPGAAKRSFISGIRLCPPASTLASSPRWSRIERASSRVTGAEYAMLAGYMDRLPPAVGADKHKSCALARHEHAAVPANKAGIRRARIPGPGRMGLFGIGCGRSCRRSELEVVEMPHHDPWSVLKVRLYPQSKLQGHVDQAPVVARQLAPGLLAVVARDLPETVEAVQREQATSWGIHDDELF